MKYSVIRINNFMGFIETEEEATYDTIEKANTSRPLKNKKKNIMGNVISKFEIREVKE